MGEAPQVQLNVIVNEQEQGTLPPDQPDLDNKQQMILKTTKLRRRIRISVYTLFILAGQAVAVLLGRVYFTKGGKSKWLETVVQLIGFPILIPFYYILPKENRSRYSEDQKSPSVKLLGSIYTAIGLLIAANTLLYSIGLEYLPVSTYTLLCASQLAFNALFSFFLNAQKFTPYIINSLVLLTISSALLVFQKNDDPHNPVSQGKYALGFMLTIAASAGFALSLSLGQIVFEKVLRGGNIKVILDMVVYESLVASCATLVGLFASGEWRTLKEEMDMYDLGKVSYIMNLVWTAMLWQLYSIGAMGLILEVSSLFSNVIGTLGLPLTPVLAVIFLHDKMDGIKGISMVLAVWGFVSYAYQHYLDEYRSRNNIIVNGDHVAPKGES